MGNWWRYILILGNRLWKIVLMLRSKTQATEKSGVSWMLSLCEEEKFMVADFFFLATAGKLHFNFVFLSFVVGVSGTVWRYLLI